MDGLNDRWLASLRFAEGLEKSSSELTLRPRNKASCSSTSISSGSDFMAAKILYQTPLFWTEQQQRYRPGVTYVAWVQIQALQKYAGAKSRCEASKQCASRVFREPVAPYVRVCQPPEGCEEVENRKTSLINL